MRVHGYCTACRRVRRVNAHVDAVVRSLGRGTATRPVHGVCDECRDEADMVRQAAWLYHRRPRD